MANPLNLYATKVFSEHPLGLWALDDQVDYLSFISDANQDLNNWTSTGVSEIVDGSDENEFDTVPRNIPFPDKPVNAVISEITNNGKITFVSPFQIQESDVNSELETISISAYMYTFSKFIDFRMGYKYINPDTLEEEEVIKSARIVPTLAWSAIAETFVLPTSFEDLEIVFELYYDQDADPYAFVINGITVGQWSEEFQLSSFGTNLIDVPSNIAIQSTKGIEAKAYGLLGLSGYYIAEDNAMRATNTGIPLVFGSQNCTVLTPKPNSPSLIVPGLGFMNASGQYNSLTAEFWIRIQSRAIQPRKIFGPISSTDGLYVEGPFLKLRIGNQVSSHFIREWDRPMLVDIKLTPNRSQLLINGESVFEMELSPSEYKFPVSFANDLSQDWLGFYAYEDVPSISVDCFGIYPYEVGASVAKRRWVYGQGVQTPTDIKGLDSSSSIFIDYPFAKYAKNFYFPSSSKWTNGNVENLVSEEDSLKAPNYSLPSFRFSNKTQAEWLEALEEIQTLENPLMTLRPNPSWSGTQGHIAFTNMNFVREQTQAFYGVFESTQLSLEKKVLFEVANSTTANKVQVYYLANAISADEGETIETEQSGTTVTISGKRHGLRTGMQILIAGTDRVASGYYEVFVISDTEFSYQVPLSQAAEVEKEEDEDIVYAYDSTIYYSFISKLADGSFRDNVFYEAVGHKTGKKFMAGIDIPRFTRNQSQELANFFGSRQRLSVYIGGAESLTDTFDGNIYRIGFSSARNLIKISHLFNDDGIPVDYENVFDDFGVNVYDAGDMYFGEDENYWELVLDGGDPYDFQSIKAAEHIATYTLVPKNDMGMFILDIAVDSYWEDYVPLSYFAKEVVDPFGIKSFGVSFLQINLDYPKMNVFDNNGNFDTSKNLVRAYVAFQPLQDGANLLDSGFLKKESLPPLGVVRPGTDWITTKYEVVDGTVVYPPEEIDFRSLSVSLYLEYSIDGITTNPVRVRSLQISSQALGHSPNKIGSKLGGEIIPFKKSGQYFNYKTVPPFGIYKGSTPYLYNTSNSGIELKETYDNSNKSGLSIPINKNASSFFKIGSMQIFLKYGEDLFPTVPIKIFEIESSDTYLKFYLKADSPSRKRGQIYVLNENTRDIYRALDFYENGNPVNRPVLSPNSWMALGLSFPGFLDFASFSGALRITSPIMFDNFTFYQTTASDDDERFGFRQWFAVSSVLGESLDWSYWSGLENVGGEVVPTGQEPFLWEQVKYFAGFLRQELDAGKIYRIYTGTDRNISEGDQLFLLKDYQYRSYNGIVWSESTVNPI